MDISLSEPILSKPKVNWTYLESKFCPGLSALELEDRQGTVAAACLPSVPPAQEPSLACGTYGRESVKQGPMKVQSKI